MYFKYKKTILKASCLTMLFGMLLFSTKSPSDTKAELESKTENKETSSVQAENKKASSAQPGNKEASAIVTGTAASAAVSKGAVSEENAKGVSLLMKNAYPKVNKLIEDYFKAKVAVDKDAISKLVDDMNYAGLEELPLMMKNIESIKLTDCYTIDGPEDKAVMVYARNEIKFKDIDTAASSLDGFYVRPDENGDLKIILSPLSNEVQKIIDEDTKREDVKALLSDVNTRFAHEINSDKKLAKLVEKLKKKQAGSNEDK